jgi:outer membrane protein OmpA-like peptidoglycan-associated protein
MLFSKGGKMFARNRRYSAFVLLLASSSSFALNLQSYRFSDSYRYSILDDSLQEKFPGRFVFTTSYGHIRSPFYYSNRDLDDVNKSIIDYNNVFTVGGSYYINRNVSVGVDFNAINNNVFDRSYNTLGDSVVKSRINLRRTDSFSFSLNPQIFIPTGEKKNFSTAGSVGGALSVVAEKMWGRLHLLGSLGGFSSKNNQYVDVDHRQLVLTQLGLSYDVMDSLNVNIETYRNFALNGKLQDEGKYFATAKHKTSEIFSTYGGAGLSGLDTAERKTWSFFVGLKFHEREEKQMQVAVAPVVAPQRAVAPPPAEDVYFGFDRSNLGSSEQHKLQRYVDYYKDSEEEINDVSVQGFASWPGSNAYNLRLSQKRAETVREFFVGQGIPNEKISTRGWGEDYPQHRTESMNRKVNIKFNQKGLL